MTLPPFVAGPYVLPANVAMIGHFLRVNPLPNGIGILLRNIPTKALSKNPHLLRFYHDLNKLSTTTTIALKLQKNAPSFFGRRIPSTLTPNLSLLFPLF
jgi:hypothetical protein